MENTQENKNKYITQHWGQPVGRCYFNRIRTIGDTYQPEPIDYLQLKSLELITEEQARKITKLYMSPRILKIIQRGKTIQEEDYWQVILLSITVYGQSAQCIKDRRVYQYLQANGYALPYEDLSIEELIEYDWLRISLE